jgi:hypothetical protein
MREARPVKCARPGRVDMLGKASQLPEQSRANARGKAGQMRKAMPGIYGRQSRVDARGKAGRMIEARHTGYARQGRLNTRGK